MKGYVAVTSSPLADRQTVYSYGGVSEEDGVEVDQDGSVSAVGRANGSPPPGGGRMSLDTGGHADIAALRAKFKTNKRWSILDKLEKRHYCRIRSCHDCMRIMNCKCLLATAMLGIFVLCALSFTRAVFSGSDRDSTNYDYIVVGGGSAGAVIASRLVEAGANVLLLEAGSGTQFDLGGTDRFAGPLTRFDIPLLWPLAARRSDDQARGLGGGAVYSSMLYLRATATDVARWGLKSLTWERLLAKYKEMESFEVDTHEPFQGRSFHGSEGPIATAAPEVIDVIAPLFIGAVLEAGLGARRSTDFNDPNGRAGAGYFHFNIFGGRRDSAAVSLLAPLMLDKRSNLVVETKATARRVLLEAPVPPEAGYRAVGVEYVRGGKVHTAYLRSNSLPLGTAFAAERSVVLACGAVGTPQLLLASGVGSAEALSMAGVELRVRVDNVGRGLGSQPTVAVVAEIGSFPSQPGGAAAMASEWMDYIDALSACDGNSSTSDRRVSYGALGSAGFAAGAFLASPYSYYGEPDIQLTLYPSVMDPLMPRSGEAVVGSSGGQVQVTVTLLAAEATQQVLLNATSPLDGYASLEPGRLSASLRVGDIDRLVWGVQAARRVLEAEPLRPLAALELSPGSLATSQQQLREWVVRSVYVGAQRAGSTRMGSDEGSVVDEEFRVRGIRGLRAAGPSVLPRPTSGSDGTATHVALAALAADYLLTLKA